MSGEGQRAITPDQVVAALREAASDWGETPRIKRWKDEGRAPSTTTICKVMGSWNAAVAAAGMEPNLQYVSALGRPRPAGSGRKKHWTRERIVAAWQAWAREHAGRPPTRNDAIGNRELPPPPCVAEVFGSLTAAAAAAGLEARAVGHSRRWESPHYSDEAMLDQLREWFTLRGSSPTVSQWLAAGRRPHVVTYAKRFGSWRAALEAAGVPARRPGERDGERQGFTAEDWRATYGSSRTMVTGGHNGASRRGPGGGFA